MCSIWYISFLSRWLYLLLLVWVSSTEQYINGTTNGVMSNPQNIKVIELEFSDPQLDIIESTADLSLFLAGTGSGKTHTIGADNAIYARKFPHVKGFIGANTYQQLSKSTLAGVFKFWEEKIGWKRDIHYVVDRIPPEGFKRYGPPLKSYQNTISMANGKLIYLSSLDNYSVIDGQEFAHASLDETKDTAEEALREVIFPRLRQPGLYINENNAIVTENPFGTYRGFNPCKIYTSPAKTDWLYLMFDLPQYYEQIAQHIFSKDDYFRKRIGNKLIIISSSYHNEHNLSPGYIDRIIEANKHNKHLIDMLVYASPMGKTGGEYYTTYDRMKHVKDIVYPEKIATHIGFDFNRRPYITSGLYKIWLDKEEKRYKWHKFAEVCLPPPFNTTEHLCDKIIELWGHELKTGLFYYGDYSGKNSRTNSVENDYDVITRKLAKYLHNTSDRVIVNEPVVQRKEFMNKLMYGSLPIDFTCSPKCINTINDFEFLREAPDGGKLKQKVKDDNGQLYEKYGHCSDETEYVATSAFYDYYKQ